MKDEYGVHHGVLHKCKMNVGIQGWKTFDQTGPQRDSSFKNIPNNNKICEKKWAEYKFLHGYYWHWVHLFYLFSLVLFHLLRPNVTDQKLGLRYEVSEDGIVVNYCMVKEGRRSLLNCYLNRWSVLTILFKNILHWFTTTYPTGQSISGPRLISGWVDTQIYCSYYEFHK